MDLNIDAGGEIELLELIDGAGGGVENVEKALVGADLELIGGLLVDVHRTVDGEFLNPGGQRDGTGHFGTCALGGFNDFDGRTVDGPVVECAKADANFLIHDGKVFLGKSGCLLESAAALGDKFLNDITRDFLEAARLH